MVEVFFQKIYDDGKDEWSWDNAMLAETKRAIKLSQNMNIDILDIGCGVDKKYYNYFREYNYTGIDVVAKKNSNYPWFINANFLDYEFSGEFDCVIDNGCLHHQPKNLLDRYLCKIHEILREGGMFSCCVWAEPFSRSDILDKRDNHYFRSENCFNSLVQKNGLHVLETTKFKNDSGRKMFHFLCSKSMSH